MRSIFAVSSRFLKNASQCLNDLSVKGESPIICIRQFARRCSKGQQTFFSLAGEEAYLATAGFQSALVLSGKTRY